MKKEDFGGENCLFHAHDFGERERIVMNIMCGTMEIFIHWRYAGSVLVEDPCRKYSKNIQLRVWCGGYVKKNLNKRE